MSNNLLYASSFSLYQKETLRLPLGEEDDTLERMKETLPSSTNVTTKISFVFNITKPFLPFLFAVMLSVGSVSAQSTAGQSNFFRQEYATVAVDSLRSIPLYPGKTFFEKTLNSYGIKLKVINKTAEWQKAIERHNRQEKSGGFYYADTLYLKGVNKIFVEEALPHETVHLLHKRFYGLTNVVDDFVNLKRSLKDQYSKNAFQEIEDFLRFKYNQAYGEMPKEFIASEFYAWYYGLYITRLIDSEEVYDFWSDKRKDLIDLFRKFNVRLDSNNRTLLIKHYTKLGLISKYEKREDSADFGLLRSLRQNI